jgi:hypothetical protein
MRMGATKYALFPIQHVRKGTDHTVRVHSVTNFSGKTDSKLSSLITD